MSTTMIAKPLAAADNKPTALDKAAAAPPFTIDGALVIEINGHPFTLEGKVGTSIVVEYHRTFEEAANLGTFADIIISVGSALGAPADFVTDIQKRVDDFKNNAAAGPLDKVAAALLSAQLRITDLGINTLTKSYQFGFVLDFSESKIEAAGIKLKAFGLKFSYQKQPQA
jgi:hypothetical protein